MLKNLPNNVLLAHISVILAIIIWAAAGPVIKLTLESVPPFTLLYIRFMIVGIVVLPFTFIELNRASIDKRDITNIIIHGLLAQTSIVFIFLGLQYTSSLDATIIGIITSILSLATGHYFFNEKINRTIEIGLFISILGTLFVMLEPIIAEHHFSHDVVLRLLGNLLSLLYYLTFLAYIIWAKFVLGAKSAKLTKLLTFLKLQPMHKKYSSNLLTFLSFYIGLASFLPMAMLENFFMLKNSGTVVSLVDLNSTAILGILYLALISSVFGYGIYQWGLKYVQVEDTAIYNYLSPVFTMPFAYLLLSEIPTTTIIIGSLLILIGVTIAETHKA